MKATFNGTDYEVDLEPISGITTPPDGKCSPTIQITEGLHNTKLSLEVCIHEALHACQFEATEKKVNRTAKDLARFLWRLGWRLGWRLT